MTSKRDIDFSLTVILLCGGKGERLLPLTNDIPKPLIMINDKPILTHIIEYLKKQDIHEIIVTTGYKSEKIREYITNYYPDEGLTIVDSGDADIIKRIQDATKYISSDCLVLYGDTLSDIDISKLVKHHRSHQQPITMTVWPLRTQFGIVDIAEDGTVTSFKEKPVLGQWINIGYIYVNYEMINVIHQYQRFEVFLHDMAEKGVLNTFKHSGMHITVNTIKELEEAERNIGKILGR